MNRREALILRELNEQLARLLSGDFSAVRPMSLATTDLQALADSTARLTTLLAETHKFASAISKGELEADPPPRNPLIAPLKQLHANLRHLTWQTKQIAAGDLDQHVDFLGEFSVAFNYMIEALREKRLAERGRNFQGK